MTVETQLIDVPISGGVDEKTRAELVSPPSFAQLINLRQIKRGSYQKRFGHTLVSNVTLSGSVVPACKRLIAYKDELLQTNNLNLYTRGTTTGAWTATTGMAPQLQITDQPVVALQSAVGSYDCLYLNGYYILAYTLSQTAGANYSIFATIIDAANGAVVAAPFNVTNGVVNGVAPWIRLVSAGNVAVLVYSSDGTYGASISRSWVSLASNATINTGWAAVATLVTDTSATAGIPHVFDACTVGANFVLAYVNNTTGVATTTVTLRSYDSTIVQQAVSSVACSAAAAFNGPRCLSISGNAADTIFMAYPLNDTAVFQVVGLNPTTLVANATPLTVVTVTNASVTGCAVLWTGTGTGIVLCGDGTTGTPGRMNIRTFQVSAGAVIGVSGYLTCQGFNFDSRPFLSNGRAYATVRPTAGGTPIPDPNQLLLVDLTQTVTDFQNGFGKPYLRVVGNITPRLAYGGHFAGMTGGSGNCIMPTSVAAVSATKFVVASPALKNAVSSSLDLVTLDWGATNLSQPCILGETVALGGSPPSFYDGVRASEIGFFQRPLITGFAFSGIGLTGTYKYIAVYEQIDARGQWH